MMDERTHERTHARYRKARNATTKAIETEYQKCLHNIIGNVTSDPRSFYRFIESKHTDPLCLTVLSVT